MKDIFGYIKRTPTREYLLRCSYLEIYNENIHDLLAPPSMSTAQPVQIHGTGPQRCARAAPRGSRYESEGREGGAGEGRRE